MALISCPECGREKVSDSAESCPDCGFGIKDYYDNIKEKQEELRHQKEQELKEQQQYQEKLDKIQKPKIPFFNFNFFIGIGIMIWGIWLANSAVTQFGTDNFKTFCGCVLLIIGMVVFVKSLVAFAHKIELYKLSKKDFLQYKQVAVEEREQIERKTQEFNEKYNERMLSNANIKCPNCGSMNVKHISTGSRMVSVGMVGIASSKIGKQYKCLNCKYQW